MPRSFKIGSDGDLEFSAGSPVIITGTPARAQRVASRLRTIREEWFLDATIGLPMLKNWDTLSAQVRTECEAVAEVASVRDIQIDQDRANRTASVTLTVVSTDGTELEVEA